MPGSSPVDEEVQRAFEDVAMEFARCYGETVDEDLYDKMKAVFATTVEKGIRDEGAEWEEPQRSFVLRYVCKIARQYAECTSCEEPDDDDLKDIADPILDQAHDVCEKKEDQVKAQLGIFCPAPRP